MLSYVKLFLAAVYIADLSDIRAHPQRVCNNHYCLLSVRAVEPGDFEDKETFCSHNNNHNRNNHIYNSDMKAWLLEIYDESIEKLLEKFLSGRHVNGNILLNVEARGGNWTWLNGKQFIGSIFDNGGKPNWVGRVTRTYAGDDFQFLADSHLTKYDALCRAETNQCSHPHSWQCNSQCIFPLNENFTWNEAQNECIKKDGELASFDDWDSLKFNQTSRAWVQNLSMPTYWIGLTRRVVKWRHAGKFVKYNRWRASDLIVEAEAKEQTCVFMMSEHQTTNKHQIMNEHQIMNKSFNVGWFTAPCNQSYHVVCMPVFNYWFGIIFPIMILLECVVVWMRCMDLLCFKPKTNKGPTDVLEPTVELSDQKPPVQLKISL
ncbi:hypothetical protein HELRODRAFT_169103 [Helobdella robusta]|uniref:C-type lectin domain-containing protein n=1 Tax=Helobdella robusta TaxID=6412 RepID=T1F1E4_HELRO|nr:hypothetical protein HELRODRAFT_169103 [Helobdella robusta]ESO09158.1 hypothetical protein HELRODRAFT_169103 [Helobdella robusta]